MAKKILLSILCLLVAAIIYKLIAAYIDQRREISFNKDIPKTIRLWSDDFKHNNTMPTECTGLGKNVSPSLHWDNLPEGTQSLAIVAVDYDAPSPLFRILTIDHWVVFNIPSELSHLDKAMNSEKLTANRISLGKNITGGTRYTGPNPPFGTHRYFFRIYALSVPRLDLIEPTKAELMKEMEGKILAYGELIGTYKKTDVQQ